MSEVPYVRLACCLLHQKATATPEYIHYVHANGLSLSRLGDTDPIADHCGVLAVTAIKRIGKERFEFADKGGVLAAVIEVFGRDGETTIDLAAWPLDRPTEIRTMFGAASMLGVWNVGQAATYAINPLQVHKSAVDWLKGVCRGVVVLSPGSAARDLLGATEMGRVAGEDRGHAEALARLVGSLFRPERFVAPSTRSEGVAA